MAVFIADEEGGRSVAIVRGKILVKKSENSRQNRKSDKAPSKIL